MDNAKSSPAVPVPPASEMKNESHSLQLVDFDGVFNVQGINEFVKKVNFGVHGQSYGVVSIIGPQSSGKSTLLNHMFQTSFTEMNALAGRSQTTKGIWLAKCDNINPCTLVMDLEGNDGRERGEDDTAFEKQGALFALAVSDILVINMWCHDLGRENAANKPLLTIVFQVMMRLFKNCKTTLLFVLRDKTQTPLEKLEEILKKDMQEIWERFHKPQGYEDTPLSNFFNVEFVALPHYEHQKEEFKKQVESLRQRIIHLIAPGGVACDKKEVGPASVFASSAEKIWKMIKEDKDLDLPAHKVMVATIRCEEIANEQLFQLSTSEDWCVMKEAAQLGPVQELGKKLRTILDSYLSEYDAEAIYFDEGVSLAKRQQLESRALDLVYPAYLSVLGHLGYRKLDNFRNCFAQDLQRGEEFAVAAENCLNLCLLEFDEECADASLEPANWDPSETREKLRRDICDHIASVRKDKLEKLKAQYEEQLSVALEEPVASLLSTADEDTWPKIRKVLESETTAKEAGLSRDLSSLGMDQVITAEMLASLADFGRRVVETRAREESRNVLILMKDRFLKSFLSNVDCTAETTKADCLESLKVLSAMAAIRLDDKPDNIYALLTSSGDLLQASSTWEGVPTTNVLITPARCKTLWNQFIEEIRPVVCQAAQLVAAQKNAVEQANAAQLYAAKLTAAEKNAAEQANAAQYYAAQLVAAKKNAAEQANAAQFNLEMFHAATRKAEEEAKAKNSYALKLGAAEATAKEKESAAQACAAQLAAAQAKNELLTYTAQFKSANAVNEETSSKSMKSSSMIGAAVAVLGGLAGLPSISN